MNTCVLMGTIVSNPELRYTQENQTPFAQMLVEFDSIGSDNQNNTLKVVAWRNLATEIQENYTSGNKVIMVGRLSMRNIDRPEGFKEKRAELTLSRICAIGSLTDYGQMTSSTTTSSIPASGDNVVPFNNASKPALKEEKQTPMANSEEMESEIDSVTPESPPSAKDLDDIPF